jgi:hypothetical protein
MLVWDANGRAFIGLDRVASYAERGGEVVLGQAERATLPSDAAPNVLVNRSPSLTLFPSRTVTNSRKPQETRQ